MLRTENSEVGEGGGGLDWVDGVGEHIGGGEDLEVFDDVVVVAADEADVG